jgi:hypothetical protein
MSPVSRIASSELAITHCSYQSYRQSVLVLRVRVIPVAYSVKEMASRCRLAARYRQVRTHRQKLQSTLRGGTSVKTAQSTQQNIRRHFNGFDNVQNVL